MWPVLRFLGNTLLLSLKEVNPSLKEEADVQQTVAVGCSLVRAALGTLVTYTAISRIIDVSYCAGETLL
jgi:hypothetical protein